MRSTFQDYTKVMMITF